MVWIRKLPVVKHECSLPAVNPFFGQSVGVGSTWQCDDCGQYWIVTDNPHPWRKTTQAAALPKAPNVKGGAQPPPLIVGR